MRDGLFFTAHPRLAPSDHLKKTDGKGRKTERDRNREKEGHALPCRKVAHSGLPRWGPGLLFRAVGRRALTAAPPEAGPVPPALPLVPSPVLPGRVHTSGSSMISHPAPCTVSPSTGRRSPLSSARSSGPGAGPTWSVFVTQTRVDGCEGTRVASGARRPSGGVERVGRPGQNGRQQVPCPCALVWSA